MEVMKSFILEIFIAQNAFVHNFPFIQMPRHHILGQMEYIINIARITLCLQARSK